jgi:hypothetical protein
VHEFTSASVPAVNYVGTKAVALARNAGAWEDVVSVLGVPASAGAGRLVGPFHVPRSDLMPAELPLESSGAVLQSKFFGLLASTAAARRTARSRRTVWARRPPA